MCVMLAAASLAVPANAASPTHPRPHPAMQKRLAKLAESNRPAGALKFGRDATPARNVIRPEDAVRDAGGLGDVRSLAVAARALVEQMWHLDLPDPRAAMASAQEASDDTYKIGLPAGDLTGDGLDDAMSFEYVIDWDLGEVRFVAVRGIGGTNGAELWSISLDGAWDAWPIAVGDLTGDGSDDVLLVRLDLGTLSETGGCYVVACAVDATLDYRWTLTLVDGSDGATSWEQLHDGNLQEKYAAAYAVAAVGVVDGIEATNAFVLPLPSGDHDGDDSPDLVLNRFDVKETFAIAYAGFFVGALVVEDLISVTTYGELVSGASGGTRTVATQEDVPGGAYLLPAGDAVGSATGDLLWETMSNVHTPWACVFALLGVCGRVVKWTLDLEMLDGATFEPAWATRIEPLDAQYFGAVAFSTDLTDDGKADVAVWEYALIGSRITVLSGADGTTAWQAPTLAVYPIGSIDGGAGSDVLTARATDDATGSTLHLERLDGATGADLVSTQHAFGPSDDGGYIDLYVWLQGDADGDGVGDIGIDEYILDEEWWEVERSRTMVESGADGSLLYEGQHDQVAAAYPAGDIDGDGLTDLLELSSEWRDDSYDVRFAGISVIDADRKWSRTDVFSWCSWFTISFTADQSGAGGDDQVYSREACSSDDVISRIDGVEQLDGNLTWGYGPPIPGDTPASGAISGTVDTTMGEVEVCVDALVHMGDGTRWVAGTTAYGSYRISGLSDGEYLVRFYDCWGYGVRSEWYDDATEVEDADLVIVADGAETTSIDAMLEEESPADPPSNDAFADALDLSSPGTQSAYTRGATRERGEPSPSCSDSVGRTVWYRFTALEDAMATLNTVGSDFDTVLSVYTGTAFGDLQEVACNDDVVRAGASLVAFPVTAGETYHVQAGGWWGSSGDLRITLASASV